MMTPEERTGIAKRERESAKPLDEAGINRLRSWHGKIVNSRMRGYVAEMLATIEHWKQRAEAAEKELKSFGSHMEV